jgi:hypothetical protein
MFNLTFHSIHKSSTPTRLPVEYASRVARFIINYTCIRIETFELMHMHPANKTYEKCSLHQRA